MSNVNFANIENIFNGKQGSMGNLADLVLDAGTQQRDKTDKDAVTGYTEQMKANGVEHWEPLKVIELNHDQELSDGSTLEAGALILVDGFQRTDAATAAKFEQFPMAIVKGSYDEAVYYSLIANKKNGVSLKGKDFQKAIKKLYELDAAWREHGKKKEMALLFGCSTKTVERAVKAIDEAVKKEAFEMFARGLSDKEVVEATDKSLSTIKRWREEWEEAEAAKNQDPEGGEGGEGGEGSEGGAQDITKLTIAEAMELKDKQVQAAILAILADAYGISGGPQGATDEPQPEPRGDESDEPPFDTEDATGEPEDDGLNDPMVKLAAEWKSRGDSYAILGIKKEQVAGWQNPKAQLSRYANKMLKQCHPDRFGKDNAAVKVLNAALAEVKKAHGIK